jgi:hypothetical protein
MSECFPVREIFVQMLLLVSRASEEKAQPLPRTRYGGWTTAIDPLWPSDVAAHCASSESKFDAYKTAHNSTKA